MVRSLSRYAKALFRLSLLMAIITSIAFFFRLHPRLPSILIDDKLSDSSQLASSIRLALAAPHYFRTQLSLNHTWTDRLKQIIRSDTIHRPDPPMLQLLNSDSPLFLGNLPKDHILAKAYSQALEEINQAARQIVEKDPIISTSDFRNRTTGIPGTSIKTDADRRALQGWLDCTSSQGEWRWEPIANTSTPRPLTVHKQGGLEAKCDRRYAQARETKQKKASEEFDGWDVRPSLKFRWYPSSRCDLMRPERLNTNLELSRREFCRLLRHKHILMVGDIGQYAMHDLMLDWTSTKPVTCYGDLYCKEHGICGNELKEDWNGTAHDLESGNLDDYVYERLPSQPNLKFGSNSFGILKRNSRRDVESDRWIDESSSSKAFMSSLLSHPSSFHKRGFRNFSSKDSSHPSRGTILRFRRSDSLWASSSPSHRRFAPVWLHDNIGIRDVNNYWITDSRKSDLVIMSRPPLPFPLDSHLQKAFTRTKEIPGPHLQYLKHTSSNTSCKSSEYFERTNGFGAGAELIDMARRMVMEVWLPEILYSLLSVRSTASPSDQLIVWRGEWRMHVDCAAHHKDSDLKIDKRQGFEWQSWWQRRADGDGPPPHPLSPSLISMMYGDERVGMLSRHDRQKEKSDTRLREPKVVFHNLQVIFQNQLMRQLGPALGIPFLDLETLSSVWRSGMVGGSSESQTGINCFNYCFPSPGMALEEGFLGGLLKIFKVGWDDDVLEPRENWVGDGFVPVRERRKSDQSQG